MDKRRFGSIHGDNEMMEQDEERYVSWWFCENILCHEGQIALMKIDFPRVFILIRDYSEAYPCDFEDFRKRIAEVNFLDPKEREGADIEEILTEAWNFLALTERKEDELYESNEGYTEW